MPDDFKINVLLPGAVWLLVSAFIGYAVVAGMGSDAITVILFVVITFVLFVMPMAVYMEYRERIENWLGKGRDGQVQLLSRLPTDNTCRTVPM